MTADGLPDGWRLVLLSELGEVNRGRSRHRPRYAEHLYGGPYPFIQTGDIRIAGGRITSYQQTYSEAGLRQSRLWPAGTMCVTIAANIAETGILAFPACFPDSVVGFIADESKCDVHFVEYTFRYLRDRIQHEATGSVQDNINLEVLGRLRLPMPPVPEQSAIVHILGTLDDKIELNRRMNETLEAMARALFKSWFVDFEPVHAKMECRWKRGQSLPGLPAHLFDLFPDRLVDSELGEIPDGWRVKKLVDLCSTQYGYTASAADEPVGPKFLRVTDINKQSWIEWDHVPHCVLPDKELERYRLSIGDIVVARMADPGKAAIVEDALEAIFASYLVRMKTESLAHSYYVYGFLKSAAYREYSEGATGGSVQANMNAKVIVGAELRVPPTALLERHLKAVLPLRRRIVANLRESSALAALRDALLPKLISGEIRVNVADKLVGRNAV